MARALEAAAEGDSFTGNTPNPDGERLVLLDPGALGAGDLPRRPRVGVELKRWSPVC